MTVRAAPPKLLVSVRNVEEARSALAGGADIIDVKDPDRGSLGRADADVICELASLSELGALRIPLSVALGEVSESGILDADVLPPAVTYAKLGLAGLRDTPDWVSRWRSARRFYDDRSASPLRWIAVVYADEVAAEAPPAREIIAVAARTRCAGVLVDTYNKAGGGLLEFATLEVLSQWAELARRHRLLFAVAGRLSLQDLPRLSSVSPDVIAVRSAVCERQDRRAAICPQRIAGLKRAMKNPSAASLDHIATGRVAAPRPAD